MDKPPADLMVWFLPLPSAGGSTHGEPWTRGPGGQLRRRWHMGHFADGCWHSQSGYTYAPSEVAEWRLLGI